MMTIRVTLDVKTHLHPLAWRLAARVYPWRVNQRDLFVVNEDGDAFEIEVTETTVVVRGPV